MKKDVHSVWKQFDENSITHSAAHYLFAIRDLHETNWYARMIDISKKLQITPWSCSIWIKSLAKKWFIEEDENKFIRLSKKAEKIIEDILQTRKTLIKFFTKNLWIDEKIATLNACKIEHLVDSEIIKKLDTYIK